MGDRARPRGPCPGRLARPSCSPAPRPSSAPSRTPRSPGRCRHARHAAGHQRVLRRAGGEDRPRPQRRDQSALGLRPQELLLRRPARRLSDLPVPAADRRQGRRSSSTCRTARPREVGITRLHLEQDAGKSLHDQHPTKTYVDLNRSGVALMEIVSEPDMRSAEEAAAYLRKLRSILRYLGTCDGNMEEGSMRCDVNVSVRRPGEPLGTRCEIKNVNSIRFVQQAIEYEARRQVEVIEEGGTIAQETRLFDSGKGDHPAHALARRTRTTTATSPIPTCCRWSSTRPGSSASRAAMPELPDAKKARFMQDYRPLRLRRRRAGGRAGDRRLSTKRVGQGPRSQARRQLGDRRAVRPAQQGREVGIAEFAGLGRGISAACIDLIADDTISGRIAKDVFAEMFETGKTAADDRRGEGPAPGHRHRRHRGGDRRGHGRATPTRWRSTARARRSCSASSSAR